MLNSVIVALLLKLLDVSLALKWGLLFLIVWILVLVVFWKLYVQNVFSDQKEVQPSSPDFCPTPSEKLRVTIVTGYLGSGKTTLVKRILHNTVGMKVLVIENEIGAEGIDHDLLLQSTDKENIVLLNNGCICCTVRSDLLSTFQMLFQNKAFSKLDWIIIETTGLADPAPLIQSFYMDSECQKKLVIDGIVTVVDVKHLPLHLTSENGKSRKGAHGEISEAIKQISYADRILLNKTDLITADELTALKRSVLNLNPTAVIFECTNAHVNIKELLNIQAFDPSKFTALNYGQLKNDQNILIERDSNGKILKKKRMIEVRKKLDQTVERASNSVSTFSLTAEDPVDLKRFNVWIAELLQLRGSNIFRMKGILNVKDFDERFVFHAVHMVFDGARGAKWADEQRLSKIVVIGVDLEKEEFEVGFTSTLA
mmetsp:Transcript_28503/g.31137  ORF Transcript_28503/g.31137 Transcript_28503/m.31137 type:complete len:426 (-) Transcript_28503:950-2227(-)